MEQKSISVALRADPSGFVAGMRVAQQSLRTFATDLDKSAARRQALTELGSAAGKVGLVAAAGVAVAVKSFADFDEQMSKVEAATGKGGAALNSLREAAVQAGADTAFSAGEAAEGIENLAKAGVSTKDILGGGLTGALDLAAAGEVEVGDAAEFASRAMTQFKLSGDKVPHVADLLAAGAGKASGDVADLGMALNQSGQVAASTGLTIEETTGALASFASAGLLGSDAGTSFKTMLQSLTPTSEKAKKLTDELGISAYDAQGNFIGLSEYAGVLQDKLSGMTVEQRQATMKVLFGSDAVRAATVLYDQGAKGIENWTNKVDDQRYAAETAGTKLDNLKGNLEALGGSLETALIGTGAAANGPVRDIVQSLTRLINTYNDLPQPVKSSVLALGAFTAVMGGGIWTFTKAISGIQALRTNLTTLTGSATVASRSMRLLGGVGLAAGIAAVGLEVVKLGQATDAADMSEMQRDLRELGRGSGATGELVKAFGEDFAGVTRDMQADGKSLGETLKYLSGRNWFDKFEEFGNSEWVDRIAEVDTGLADLADKSAPAAARAFDRLAKEGQRAGLTYDEVLKLFPEYEGALESQARASEKQADAARKARLETGKYTDTSSLAGIAAASAATSVKGLRQAQEAETEATRDAITAHNKLTDKLIAATSKTLTYEQAVDDARKASQKGTRTIDLQTQAGRDNTQALLTLAGSWNDLGENVQNQKGKFDLARRNFIDTAREMGATREQAIRLADKYLDIPTDIKSTADLNKDQADRNADSLKDKYGSVPGVLKGRAELDIKPAKDAADYLIKKVFNAGIRPVFNQIGDFTGTKPISSSPGIQQFDRGGHTGPGGKYDPAGIVHAREFVIRSESTADIERKAPGLLDRMNRGGSKAFHADPPPHMPGYWTGGGVFPLPGGALTNRHATPYYGAWFAGDFNGPGDDTGDRIVAWKKGRVARAAMNGQDGSYGNVTEINHDDGNMTRYAHQSAIRVRGGQQVNAGQNIGSVGATGNVTGPHLHMEIKGGKASIVPGGGGGSAGIARDELKDIRQGIRDVRQTARAGFGGSGIDRRMLAASMKGADDLAKLLDGLKAANVSGSASAAAGAGSGAAGIWKSLMSTGFFSKQQAAGVMGNMKYESGLNHLIVQGGGTSTNPASAGGGGWGLVQWTPGGKVVPYLNGDTSVASQIDALTAQLQGKGSSPEGAAGAALRRADSVRAATIAFETQYERHAGGIQPGRQSAAQSYFDQFKGGKSFDQGGMLRDVGANRTGKPEAVLTPVETQEYRAHARAAVELARGFASQQMAGKQKVTLVVADRKFEAWMHTQVDDRIGQASAHERTLARMR